MSQITAVEIEDGVFESVATIDNGDFGRREVRFETGRLAKQAAGSVVAYDPAVKISLLGVDPALVDRVGTVDEQVATQMAKGARRTLGVDVAVATTGVAGPGPSEGHPAGTVWLACAWPEGVSTRRLALTGERSEVRAAAVAAALTLVAEAIGRTSTGGGPDLSQGLT